MFELNTIFIGKVLFHFKSLASTNDFALDLLSRKEVAEGTVVLTDDQFKGRGQRGTSWLVSPEKNLTFSLILFPTFLKPLQQIQLSMAIAVAVRNAMSKFIEEEVYIKWPNDIYIGHQKAAGLLIQNSLTSSHVKHSVVGIGINVNQKDFGKDIPNAVSLSHFRECELDRNEVLNAIGIEIEKSYLTLKKSPSVIEKSYLEHLYKKDEWHEYSLPDGSTFLGMIVGVGKSGHLIVKKKDETISDFDLKEIIF